MNKYVFHSAIMLLTLLFSCNSKKGDDVAATGNYPVSRLTDSVKSQFSSLVNNSYTAQDSGMVAMTVYLQQADKILLDTSYFFSNNDMPLPNDSTVFQMGSVTKTFTAALIARQVNQGKMNLAMPAQNYLPRNAGVRVPTMPDHYNGQQVSITLGNLASMNAGLHRNAPVKPDTNKTPYLFAFDYLDKNPPLLFKPGSTCNVYSNLGFGILGLVACLQAYPNVPTYYNNYEQVVTDSLLTPLKMKDTRITLTAAEMKRRALPYGADKQPSGYDNPNWPFNYAAGGLYSTLADMRLYAKEMAAPGSYLTQKDVDTLIFSRAYVYKDTCQVPNGHPAAGQGMAWVTNADMKDNSGAAFSRYSKDGGLGGFSTYITCSTPTINAVKYKAYVVLWANRQGFPVQQNAQKLMQLMYDLLQ